jgi:hypothetical protein
MNFEIVILGRKRDSSIAVGANHSDAQSTWDRAILVSPLTAARMELAAPNVRGSPTCSAPPLICQAGVTARSRAHL